MDKHYSYATAKDVVHESTEVRLTQIEGQLARIVSDAESEKTTRKQVNIDFENRLRAIEKTIWKAMGALGIIQTVLWFLK